MNAFGAPGEDDSLRLLAAGVIAQAAKDVSKGDVQAAAWLFDQETVDSWMVLAHFDYRVILAWVKDGCRITRKRHL